MYTPETIQRALAHHEEPEIGRDVIMAAQGTVTKILSKQFAEWARRYASRSEIIEDTISNMVLALSSAYSDPSELQHYANEAAKAALAEHRRWVGVQQNGNRTEVPWDPSIDQNAPKPIKGRSRGFDVFDEDQRVGHAAGDIAGDEPTPIPVDLGLLTEREVTILTLLGECWRYEDIALQVGWHPDQRTDGSHYVQNQLRTIRRKLTGGKASTQKGAWEWLNAQRGQ